MFPRSDCHHDYKWRRIVCWK